MEDVFTGDDALSFMLLYKFKCKALPRMHSNEAGTDGS